MRLDLSVVGKNKQEIMTKIEEIFLELDIVDTNCSEEDYDYSFQDTNDLWEENPKVEKFVW